VGCHCLWRRRRRATQELSRAYLASGRRELARVALAPFKAWLEKAWDQPHLQETMRQAWRAQDVVELESRGWAAVIGPAGAIRPTLRKMGWQADDHLDWLTEDGLLVNAWESCPKDAQEEAGDRLVEVILQEWADKRPVVDRWQVRPSVSPLRHLLNGKGTGQHWTQHHRYVLRAVVAGVLPEPTGPLPEGESRLLFVRLVPRDAKGEYMLWERCLMPEPQWGPRSGRLSRRFQTVPVCMAGGRKSPDADGQPCRCRASWMGLSSTGRCPKAGSVSCMPNSTRCCRRSGHGTRLTSEAASWWTTARSTWA